MGACQSRAKEILENSSNLIKTARFCSFEDQALIDGENEIVKLNYVTVARQSFLGSKIAFLIFELANSQRVKVGIVLKRIEDQENKAVIYAESYEDELLGKSYVVLDSKRKWAALLQESMNFMKSRPIYKLNENDCFTFIDHILENFVVDYDGIAKNR